MNNWTRIGLVLLRIVIGWHFLFEGIEKLESWYNGPREGHQVWSAAGYLSEAQGPLAPWFRKQAGETDADVLAKLTLPKDAGKLPPALDKEWTTQLDLFVAHYGLGKDNAVQPEYVGMLAFSSASAFPAGVPWPAVVRSIPKNKTVNAQLALTQEDVKLARTRALQWFAKGNREVASRLPSVAEKIKETTPQRIDNYKKTLDKIREIETAGMPAFDKDVYKDNYRALKKEAGVSRNTLLADVNKPIDNAMSVARFRLSKSQRDLGPVPASTEPTNLDRINFVTRWGLTIVGACLIIGLFTRLSCVAGAAFLLMFYLAMPALPWLPESPRAEGHYLFINKNIIEMVALLTLATTASGKWLGLDGLVQFLNPWNWRRR
jgi:uncharacterized membrane protein YphA (DoxX/SURF4 family)